MPHSILKQPESFLATATSSLVPRSRDERNRETALYHAELLQQRKETEALILVSTEALLDLPASPTADPARPSFSDAAFFKNALKSFQTSDYDALIEERNINNQCGYVLCPRHNRKQDTEAKYRILQGNGRGPDALKFVLTQSLQTWCSEECGKRALYVKVQLDEEPAWSRTGPSSEDITILEDEATSQSPSVTERDLTEGISKLDLGLREDQFIERMKDLAIERGDGNLPNKLRGLGDLNIREKTTEDGNASPAKPVTGKSDLLGQHNSVEGYVPMFSNQKMKRETLEDDQDDLMRTI